MSEHVAHLRSGLTVAVDPMAATRSVSIGVWVRVGARDEADGIAGVSHFLEHLLFKGTATRDAATISRSVDRVGGDINAMTAQEYTAYYCRVPARHVELGVELLGDVLTSPALRDGDVESERQVILEELSMDDDSPEDVVHRRFAAELFAGHPLGRDSAGTRATVKAITVDDVRAFFGDHYVAGNTVVAVAGAVDPDQVVALVERHFDAMPTGPDRRRRVAPHGLAPVDTRVDVDDDTEQVHLVLGGAGLSRHDPDREAFDVVNHVLGGGLSSRLFDEIRERRGLAYSVFSSTASYSDAGSWQIYAGTSPEHGAEVERLTRHELDRLVSDGVTDDELDVAIGYLVGSYELGLEDSGARMSRLGGQLSLRGTVRPVEEQLDRWRSVTSADVRWVLDRIDGLRDPLTVALGPVRHTGAH